MYPLIVPRLINKLSPQQVIEDVGNFYNRYWSSSAELGTMG